MLSQNKRKKTKELVLIQCAINIRGGKGVISGFVCHSEKNKLLGLQSTLQEVEESIVKKKKKDSKVVARQNGDNGDPILNLS
jgi:hypothetical protein